MTITSKIKAIFEGDKRSLNAHKNSLLMIVLRGVNILVSFLYVPLLIDSLNVENYGIWVTITSIIAWLHLLDIGLGNGLRNKLTHTIAANDISTSKKLIGTSYACVFIFIIAVSFIFLLCSSFINWTSLLNVDKSMNQEITNLMNIVFILFMVQVFFSLINSILLALQKPALSSLITTVGQILSYIAVYISVHIYKESSLVFLGTIISIIPVIVISISTFIFFVGKYRNYKPTLSDIKLSYAKDIFGLGMKFLYIHMITILLYQTSVIVIAQNIGQEAVTEYNIAYKYVGIISMLFIIIVTPYWSATTDAIARNDKNWIIKSVKFLTKIRYALIVLGLLLVLFSKLAYKLWLDDKVEVNYPILIGALIFFALQISYSNYGMILNGLNKVKLQMYATTIVVIIFIPTVIILSRHYGLIGTFIALSLAGVLNVVWAKMQYHKIINNTAVGIWDK